MFVDHPLIRRDTIEDREDNEFRNGFDVVTFKEGITADDLIFSRVGNSNDVTIRYVGKPGRTIKATVTVRTNEPRQRSIAIQVTGRS